MKEILRELCLAFGPSGYEDGVRAIIERELSSVMPRDSEIIRDALGGIYLHIKNEGAPRLMLSAHMDEVGFMVTEITERGDVKFAPVGGIDPLVLGAKRVIFENGTLGVISTKPIHLLDKDEREKKPEISKMYADIGAKSKEEAQKTVHIGDYFTFKSDFVEFGQGLIKAKALDDRHGCSALLFAIRELVKSGEKSPYDLYFAFTTREEVGFSGALCASEIIKPELAIVIESKAVLDLPEIPSERAVGALGEGALISYADRGAIMDRALTDELISVCERNSIKYQINRAVSGGNDTNSIQGGAYGARVALISAPSRYIHSGACVISYSDFECICNALLKFITDKGVKDDRAS